MIGAGVDMMSSWVDVCGVSLAQKTLSRERERERETLCKKKPRNEIGKSQRAVDSLGNQLVGTFYLPSSVQSSLHNRSVFWRRALPSFASLNG